MTLGTRILNWLDQRTGIRKLSQEALDEPIPGGARWSYVFGSGLLYILLSQIVTGVFLAMYYVASADHAHTTIAVRNASPGSDSWHHSPLQSSSVR